MFVIISDTLLRIFIDIISVCDIFWLITVAFSINFFMKIIVH